MIQIVVMADCASNYGVFKIRGSKGDTHTVTMHGSEGPAYCTCKAFQFSGERRECKHIAQVWKEACMYNPQWHDANPEPKLKPVDFSYQAFAGEKCKCGGPLVYVKRAV